MKILSDSVFPLHQNLLPVREKNLDMFLSGKKEGKSCLMDLIIPVIEVNIIYPLCYAAMHINVQNTKTQYKYLFDFDYELLICIKVSNFCLILDVAN